MNEKKVVAVIVEGPSDEAALGSIMKEYFADDEVQFVVVHGDITTEDYTSVENVISKINNLIDVVKQRYGYSVEDFMRIIHIADTDGAFIKDKVIYADVNFVQYYTPFQKSIETLEDYLYKLKEYNQKIHICGERNSYSKTDHDATFMRMKEDAMGNGQLKPAYNLQHGADAEYITWLTIGPQPTDTTTLIPFLKEAEEYLKFKYKNITADAGYESEENYLFLESNGQISYIKPANYEISKTRKYKNDIGKLENMEYNPQSDIYTCKNGKHLTVDCIKSSKSKTGYVSQKTIYRCEDCTGCVYKSECIKGNNCKTPLEERTKVLQVAKTFIKYRQEDLERILSDEGILYRTNRSIQAEGSFGDLKQDMQFRRYLSKGTSNVLAESILLAMARNINKLHNKIQKNRTGTHLFPLKSA